MQCFGGSICNSDKAPFLATSKFLQGRVNVLQFMQANAKIIKDQSLKKWGIKSDLLAIFILLSRLYSQSTSKVYIHVASLFLIYVWL